MDSTLFRSKLQATNTSGRCSIGSVVWGDLSSARVPGLLESPLLERGNRRELPRSM